MDERRIDVDRAVAICCTSCVGLQCCVSSSYLSVCTFYLSVYPKEMASWLGAGFSGIAGLIAGAVVVDTKEMVCVLKTVVIVAYSVFYSYFCAKDYIQ